MSYTFKDLAAEVLANVSTPLTANEIWAKAKEMGLTSKLSSQGQTPEVTLGARLYDDVKKDNSRFVAVGDHPKRFQLKNQPREDFIGEILPGATDVSTSTPHGSEAPALHYSFLECAEKVLTEVADRQPMHYREITRIALNRGWLQTGGLTPEQTLHVAISSNIRRSQERGETPKFTQTGSGHFGLSRWEGVSVNQKIEKNNKKVKKDILHKVSNMEDVEVENLVARLMCAMGFEEVELTPRNNDHGVDVYGRWTIAEGISYRYAVQVKRWTHNVGSPQVHALRGALKGGELGIFVTTSDFSSGAREDAQEKTKGPAISLINGEQLVEFLVRYNVIGRRRNVELLEFDEPTAE